MRDQTTSELVELCARFALKYRIPVAELQKFVKDLFDIIRKEMKP